jgi:hypothetical protein
MLVLQYYEAVYLLERHIARLPVLEDGSRSKLQQRLTDEALYFKNKAETLMNDEANGMPAVGGAGGGGVSVISDLTYSPRSPFTTTSNSNTTANGARHRAFFPDDPGAPRKGSDRSLVTSSSSVVDNLASQANAKLAHAIDLDEAKQTEAAIASYVGAAETYLQAIQKCSKTKTSGRNSVSDVLKRRLEQTLDRIEELKNPHKQQKKIQDRMSARSTSSLSPSSLTAQEIEILKQSSLIASGVFLPWSDADAETLLVEIQRPGTQQPKLFTDSDGSLLLSAKQQERFHCWARPSEILRLRQQNAVLGSVLKNIAGKPCIVKSITPYTIKQKYVTDCSFIASLCICATFERRFRKQLITSILYPQDEMGNLIYNPAGK